MVCKNRAKFTTVRQQHKKHTKKFLSVKLTFEASIFQFCLSLLRNQGSEHSVQEQITPSDPKKIAEVSARMIVRSLCEAPKGLHFSVYSQLRGEGEVRWNMWHVCLQVSEIWPSRISRLTVLHTNTSLLLFRKAERFPWRQYSTMTMSGPVKKKKKLRSSRPIYVDKV